MGESGKKTRVWCYLSVYKNDRAKKFDPALLLMREHTGKIIPSVGDHIIAYGMDGKRVLRRVFDQRNYEVSLYFVEHVNSDRMLREVLFAAELAGWEMVDGERPPG